MPRYKLRLAQPGESIYGDGDTWIAAETAPEAKHYFLMNDGEWPEFVHSYIGRGRCVTKRDIENEDAHEDAEPGDTTYDIWRDDGKDLSANDVRFWARGPWSPHWSWQRGEDDGCEWIVKVGPLEFKAATREEAEGIQKREVELAVEAWKLEQRDETLGERIIYLLTYGHHLDPKTAARIYLDLRELIEEEFGCELPSRRPAEVVASV